MPRQKAVLVEVGISLLKRLSVRRERFNLSCRREQDNSKYDLVIGGVANDKVFNTVELYFDGLIDKNEAIKRLRYEKPNLQICFRTARALSALRFLRSEQVC